MAVAAGRLGLRRARRGCAGGLALVGGVVAGLAGSGGLEAGLLEPAARHAAAAGGAACAGQQQAQPERADLRSTLTEAELYDIIGLTKDR